MSFQFVVERDGARLVPASIHDLEILGKMPPALPVMGKFWQPRSLQHQRWYRGLLALVVRATDRWASTDALHLWLKIKAGLVEQVVVENNISYHVIASTAFDSMDQGKFKDYTEKALDILFESGVLHRSTKKDVLREIANMTGVDVDTL